VEVLGELTTALRRTHGGVDVRQPERDDETRERRVASSAMRRFASSGISPLAASAASQARR
jgi:hypothetical protein